MLKNLQQLMIEIYKCNHKLNPKFMWQLFPSRDLSYQLRTGSTKLIIPPIKNKIIWYKLIYVYRKYTMEFYTKFDKK